MVCFGFGALINLFIYSFNWLFMHQKLFDAILDAISHRLRSKPRCVIPIPKIQSIFKSRFLVEKGYFYRASKLFSSLLECKLIKHSTTEF